MAAQKTAAKAEEQKKIEILTGIVDPEARTYTMQKMVTMNGEEKEGTFVFRYPTVADRLRQGVIQSRLLGGTPVESLDIVTYNVAYATAFLASVTMQKPSWFTYENMESIEELQSMFTEVDEFVRSFRSNTK